jgi:hypothetical protein
VLFLCPMGVRNAAEAATATAIRNGSGEVTSSRWRPSDAHGGRHDRGGGVVEDVRQRHRHHHQHRQDRPGGQARRSAPRSAPAIRPCRPMPRARRRAGSSSPEAPPPATRYGRRSPTGQDAQQHVAHRHQPQRDGQVRASRDAASDRRPPKRPIAAHVLPSPASRKGPGRPASAAEPGHHVLGTVGGRQQQQDVAGLGSPSCAAAW